MDVIRLLVQSREVHVGRRQEPGESLRRALGAAEMVRLSSVVRAVRGCPSCKFDPILTGPAGCRQQRGRHEIACSSRSLLLAASVTG